MSADEEKFGRAVGDQLRQETADVRANPGLAAAVRARRARRSWTVRAAVGAPLTAAAAAVAVLVAPAGPGSTGVPPTQPKIENVAQVQRQTIEALRSAKDLIIHEKNEYDTGYTETWTDRATDRHRLDNYSTLVQPTGGVEAGPDDRLTVPAKPEPEVGPMHRTQSNAATGKPGDRHYLTVDWELRTWSTFHDTEVVPEPEVPDVLDPDKLKQAIDEGRLELISPERVGDRDTHHLRLFATVRGYQIDLWVDATSYLPVRQTATVIDGPAEPVMTSDYDWLPRSAENLAKLELAPPPDFTRT